MTQVETPMVTATRTVEESSLLDRVGRLLDPFARAVLADRRNADVLRGMWLGHAVHPLLTDLPLGLWTSAQVLDLVGGRASRPASQRLIGLGTLAAVPTGLTGLAEWGSMNGTRERRVGVVHALVNSTALSLYVASYAARRRGQHGFGVVAGLAAGGAAAMGGYLGGHLTAVRKVSSYHPAFDATRGPASR